MALAEARGCAPFLDPLVIHLLNPTIARGCSDGEVWKRQRRLANPAFRRAAIDKYGQVSNSVEPCGPQQWSCAL